MLHYEHSTQVEDSPGGGTPSATAPAALHPSAPEAANNHPALLPASASAVVALPELLQSAVSTSAAPTPKPTAVAPVERSAETTEDAVLLDLEATLAADDGSKAAGCQLSLATEVSATVVRALLKIHTKIPHSGEISRA